MILKVMYTTYCHIENDACGVQKRQMKGRRRYMRQTSEAKDRTTDVYSLQRASHNKDFQGHQDEKAKP